MSSPCPVQSALLTPRVNPGSLYRCGKSTFKERAAGHDSCRGRGGLKAYRNDSRRPDLITYQVNWLKCARDHHRLDVDYLGLWNEMPWGTVEFVKELKKALVKEGLRTQIILGDGQKGQIPPVLEYKNDTEFMAAFGGVGLHYACDASSEHGYGQQLLAAGKKVWSSEDLWSEAEWPVARPHKHPPRTPLLLCQPCALNRHRSTPGHAIVVQSALKSSLPAAAGGKAPRKPVPN